MKFMWCAEIESSSVASSIKFWLLNKYYVQSNKGGKENKSLITLLTWNILHVSFSASIGWLLTPIDITTIIDLVWNPSNSTYKFKAINLWILPSQITSLNAIHHSVPAKYLKAYYNFHHIVLQAWSDKWNPSMGGLIVLRHYSFYMTGVILTLWCALMHKHIYAW